MFSRAVIFTDLSLASDAVISRADSLRDLGVDEVVLAHVYDVMGGAEAPGAEDSEAFERQAARLEGLGLRLRVDSGVGTTDSAMREVVERNAAALVVLGCGHAGDEGALFREHSRLAGALRRPVLVTPLSASAPAGKPLLERVLFPTDFSSGASEAARAVRSLAARRPESVTVLHVTDIHPDPEDDRLPAKRRAEAATALAEVGAGLRGSGAMQVDAQLVVGDPPAEVRERMVAGGYSLVVLGTGRDQHEPDARPGTVESAVTAACAVPVLLVPPTRH